MFGCGAPDTGPDGAGADTMADQKLADFEAMDLQGNTVRNDIFKENEITMINIWGTFCGPCIREMPDLQRLQKDVKDQQVQVIGIVADMKAEEARRITAEQGAAYLNLIPDQSLIDNLVTKFDYVPVTVFVDSEGVFLDTIVSGSRDYESYKDIIETLLADNQDQAA